MEAGLLGNTRRRVSITPQLVFCSIYPPAPLEIIYPHHILLLAIFYVLTSCEKCTEIFLLTTPSSTPQILSEISDNLCGNCESLEVAGLIEKVPLTEWAVYTRGKGLDAHRQRELFFEMSDDPAMMRRMFSRHQLCEQGDVEQNMAAELAQKQEKK